jgi:hypothetical protein
MLVSIPATRNKVLQVFRKQHSICRCTHRCICSQAVSVASSQSSLLIIHGDPGQSTTGSMEDSAWVA